MSKFDNEGEVPMWMRAVVEVLRLRSLIIFAAVTGVISLWWM